MGVAQRLEQRPTTHRPSNIRPKAHSASGEARTTPPNQIQCLPGAVSSNKQIRGMVVDRNVRVVIKRAIGKRGTSSAHAAPIRKENLFMGT